MISRLAGITKLAMKVVDGKFRTENLNLLRIEVTNLDEIVGKEEEIPRLNQIQSFNTSRFLRHILKKVRFGDSTFGCVIGKFIAAANGV